MVQSLSYNDMVLLASLLYSCIDLGSDWEVFNQCSRPIHQWLLVSYACVILFRGLHLLGAHAAAQTIGASPVANIQNAAGDFLLDLRHKGAMPRAVVTFTWLVGLPFFMLWTALGTNWLWHVVKETPECMPAATQLYFSGFWLLLCYVWLAIHIGVGVVALVLERRVRRAEGDLRAIEDDDTVQRWGQVSHLTGYQALSGEVAPNAGAGLTPAEIKALPLEEFSADRVSNSIAAPPHSSGEAPCSIGTTCLGSATKCSECAECPICITDLESGDVVRRLPVCGHVFHRSCIDLWLLRRADCPLCKRCVRGDAREGEWV